MNLFDGRVFFLGAGFSAGAGVPLTQKLLPQALEIFRREGGGLFERVANYANNVDVDLSADPNAEDMARFCTYLDFIELREFGGGERWSKEGSRERVALKFFLAKAIATATPPAEELPAYYIDFAKGLKIEDVIVTFNWDILLERTLDYVGTPYSYTHEQGKLNIMKLHGSVHWIEGKPRAMGKGRPLFDYYPLGFKEGMVETEVYCSDFLKKDKPWHMAKSLVDEVKPLLVLPGYGKAVDVRLLAGLWYRPEFLNIRQGGVSIVGLSVSHDDYIVESLFRYLFRATFSSTMKVRILNPAADAGATFSRLADSGLKIEFIQKRFEANTVELALLNA